MSRLIDLTGQHFSNLTVLKRAENNKEGRAMWLCQCKCGNQKIILGKDLRAGKVKSCGCLQKQRTSEVNSINEIGNKYGFLTVIRRATQNEIPHNNTRSIYWVCQCECGNIKIANGHYLRSGKINSCGCISSKNNAKIDRLLTQNNISFIKEYKFNDLKDKNKLSFDFFVNKTYVIEFDGKQHFCLDAGWNTERKFNYTHQHDLIKNKYCFEHNIPIIRIPYNVDYNINDLKLETTRFLLTPENEQNYYKLNNEG